MAEILNRLEPTSLWRHFESLSAIPRASGNEEGARQYVLAQAARLGLEAISDSVGNIVVRKPARPGRESAVPAVLQGHLDMVCEKNEGTAHNFDTDPIRLVIDGDWLKADGTTLGADNGVGAAAALAVMGSDDVAHGPLEFLFTVDEETGLTGASEFPAGLLHARYLLNLDGEEEGTLCIGCAGGLNTVARREVAWQAAGSGDAWRIKVAGLQGGHSGIDIHRGRGNAIRILGRLLQTLMRKIPVAISAIEGGSKRNAIPREASATIIVERAYEADLREVVGAIETAVRSELGAFEAGLRITLERAERPERVIGESDAAALASLLASQHHGVIDMSPDIPGLVQTSTNLATLAVKGEVVEIATTQRSAIASSKLAAGAMVTSVFRMAGYEVEHTGGYPGWKPEPGSDIVKLAKSVHNEVLGVAPELAAMHAGLECGVIGEKYPGMQMIAFGPHIVDVHSPSEKIRISSVPHFWKFLTALLERV
ncbi:MAG TPA: aminoacyl-histidine dipeptidase, partial [Gemmatimonadaceae bacterium]|nr:aminoacyl-histidine dipeptidase [Gemmatimonadaceae bacterium]